MVRFPDWILTTQAKRNIIAHDPTYNSTVVMEYIKHQFHEISDFPFCICLSSLREGYLFCYRKLISPSGHQSILGSSPTDSLSLHEFQLLGSLQVLLCNLQTQMSHSSLNDQKKICTLSSFLSQFHYLERKYSLTAFTWSYSCQSAIHQNQASAITTA